MIVIKNMKMPSSCYDCPFAKNERTNDYGSFCECGILEDYETINLLEHSKSPNCPLVEQAPILGKIRAEIEQNAYPIVHGVNNHELGMTLYGINQVFDKYKADRSVEDGNEM